MEAVRRLFRRRSSDPESSQTSLTAGLIDAAAARYLAGDTAGANRALADTRRADPGYFEALSRDTVALQADLERARAAETVHRLEASDHYTGDHVRVYWEAAKREFETLSPRENANALVYQIYTAKLRDAIAAHRPDAVLDFGCACGLPLFTLAKAFPSVHFGGVDRQEILRSLNEVHFTAPNLSFHAGDVLDLLPRFAPGHRNRMLVHVRTGIMVYPAFLDRLYATAAANGFTSVALYEIASLSCVSWTFRDQDTGFASEAHRSTMFLHDYAAASRRVGFRPTVVERMPHGYSLTKNNMLPGDTYTFVLAQRP